MKRQKLETITVQDDRLARSIMEAVQKEFDYDIEYEVNKGLIYTTDITFYRRDSEEQ